MSDYILFLNGSYPQQHLSFYCAQVEGKFTVAVDGGYEFFASSNLIPDLLIGDFDSLPESGSELPRAGETIRYPVDKNKTDAQLAFEYCLEHGARSIDIIQPETGEPDHFLGNLFLLASLSHLSGKERPLVRVLSHLSEIRCIEDETIDILGCAGDTLSIIPISTDVSLTCSGVKYPAENLSLKKGESGGLRNQISSSHAVIDVRGQAFMVRLSPGG